MKIAYLYSGDLKTSGGVSQKIKFQIDFLKKCGHEVLLLDWTSFSLSLPSSASFVKRFLIISRFFRFCRIYLRKNNYEVVYMRTHLPTWSMYKITLDYKVFIEINSLEKEEYWKTSKLRYVFYLLFDGFIKKKAAGLICVSNEIQTSLSSFDVPKLVIPNSCYVLDIPEAFFKNRTKPTRPVFVFCGTNQAVWHGVDKILWLSRKLPEFDFELYLDSQVLWGEELPSNFKAFVGATRQEMVSAYSRATVGLGTLALHRKNMQEASPLKVREYLGYGIPILIAYDDTGLRNVEKDFILRIPNIEKNIEMNWHEIRDFALRIFAQEDQASRISLWHKSVMSAESLEGVKENFIRNCI